MYSHSCHSKLLGLCFILKIERYFEVCLSGLFSGKEWIQIYCFAQERYCTDVCNDMRASKVSFFGGGLLILVRHAMYKNTSL